MERLPRSQAFSETNEHLIAMTCEEKLVVDARDSVSSAKLQVRSAGRLVASVGGACDRSDPVAPTTAL